MILLRVRYVASRSRVALTIAEAAGRLVWSRAEMNRAIRNGEIEVVETCSGKRIALRELAAFALQQWPLTVIEKALGRERMARVIPDLAEVMSWPEVSRECPAAGSRSTASTTERLVVDASGADAFVEKLSMKGASLRAEIRARRFRRSDRWSAATPRRVPAS